MPKKYFRKYLPDHASVKTNRFIRVFGSVLHHHNLWHLHRRSVAGGVAIGAFTGLMPAPFQMLSAAIFAIIFRVNLPVAVATTWYTNPFTFVPLYYAAFRIGEFVTGESGAIPAFNFDWSNSAWTEFIPAAWEWLTQLGLPVILGTLILASILALAGYLMVRLLWRLYIIVYWHKRKRRRMNQKSP